MSLFSCKSCAEKERAVLDLKEAWKAHSDSREADLTHLREENKRLIAKITEMQAPGITHRTELPKRKAPETVYPKVPMAAPLAGHHA